MIGFLRSSPLASALQLLASFRRGLKETGFIEGQNILIEYRSADNQIARLPELAAELIHQPVALIVGNDSAIRAAMAVTTTVPVVFAMGGDPVQDGFVTSLNRPGGNVTGVVFIVAALGAKRLELLRQLMGKEALVGVLVNLKTTETLSELRDVQAAAQEIGQQLVIADVDSDHAIEAAFENFLEHEVGWDFFSWEFSAFLTSNREQIVSLAAHHGTPAIYSLREYVTAGGLASYGTSIAEAYRQAGIYAGRIVNGERPGDLPVIRSTKFELVLNLKTAKTSRLHAFAESDRARRRSNRVTPEHPPGPPMTLGNRREQGVRQTRALWSAV